MKRRSLGKTGLECSEIGLGTWALGSRIYGETDDRKALELIQGAVDQGVNFFDTAPLYGSKTEDGVAETVLGKGLGAHLNEVIISTKFGRTATDVVPGRFHASEARKSCEASLRRLGRESIDLFFFHSPFSPDEIHDDVWEELSRLKSEGKIKHIGHSVSIYEQTAEMSAQWMRDRRIEAIQVVLGPFNRETRPLIQTAIEEGCGVVARECLANGFLSGAISKDTVFPEGSLNARYSREEIAERVEYAEQLRSILQTGPIQTLPEATYRWVLDQPGVSLALSGAKNLAELEDCLTASAKPAYSQDTLQAAEAAHKKDFPPA